MISTLTLARATAAAPPGIAAFNRALVDATRRMDERASLALWEDDGVSLLPRARPLVGKPAIKAFLDRTTTQLAGAKMQSFTCECRHLSVSGRWASEWCVEHQVVKLPGGKPLFDGWGNLLYVLHRGKDGRWRIHTEMWSPALPATGAKR